jgi:hypothetical protein
MAPHFKSLRKEGSHDIRNGRKEAGFSFFLS